MSTTRAADELAITAEEEALIDRDFVLHQQFLQAVLQDDDLVTAIPHGAVLVLLPDQDPALAEANLRAGIEAARRGKNVYVCHVYRTDADQSGGVAYGPYPPSGSERQ